MAFEVSIRNERNFGENKCLVDKHNRCEKWAKLKATNILETLPIIQKWRIRIQLVQMPFNQLLSDAMSSY